MVKGNYTGNFPKRWRNFPWLMMADPSLPGWGRRSAPPPRANGGRAAIQPSMNFVCLRLAKRQRRSHVRCAIKWWGLALKAAFKRPWWFFFFSFSARPCYRAYHNPLTRHGLKNGPKLKHWFFKLDELLRWTCLIPHNNNLNTYIQVGYGWVWI